MRKKLGIIFVAVLLAVSACTISLVVGEGDIAYASGDYVYIGGYPIGISIATDGLIVVDVTAVQTDSGEVFPLAGAKVQKGDVLQKFDGESLISVYQLQKLLNESKDSIELTVKHKNGSVTTEHVTPANSVSGERKLGVVVKEDVSGIGTMTFVTLDNRFGALGHHVLDGESGLGEELDGGRIYNTSVSGVIKGESGRAGGLIAPLNRLATPIGEIYSNTNIGIYGEFTGAKRGNLIEIAKKGEATIGKAQIYSTVDGDTPKLYDIEIVKVIEQNYPEEKGLVIVANDQRLIDKTGGIVQGMSGSPIVQNGKLVGAVTHVFIGDSTRGYGVHARFMLREARHTNIQQLEVA